MPGFWSSRQRKPRLTKAFAWADELTGNPKLKRTDIARREGISRARVAQLLKLIARGRKYWEDLRRSGNHFSLQDLPGIARGSERR